VESGVFPAPDTQKNFNCIQAQEYQIRFPQDDVGKNTG